LYPSPCLFGQAAPLVCRSLCFFPYDWLLPPPLLPSLPCSFAGASAILAFFLVLALSLPPAAAATRALRPSLLRLARLRPSRGRHFWASPAFDCCLVSLPLRPLSRGLDCSPLVPFFSGVPAPPLAGTSPASFLLASVPVPASLFRRLGRLCFRTARLWLGLVLHPSLGALTPPLSPPFWDFCGPPVPCSSLVCRASAPAVCSFYSSVSARRLFCCSRWSRPSPCFDPFSLHAPLAPVAPAAHRCPSCHRRRLVSFCSLPFCPPLSPLSGSSFRFSVITPALVSFV